MDSNSTTRFTDRVENYIKYRPSYPAEVIEYLKSEGILRSDSVIADIGSGTGISAELFLKNGNAVYGVEPNDAMREAAEKLLSAYSNFESINATAEETSLADNSFDLITCAQAFHWFDIPKVKIEFKRILKPTGSVCLIWNERILDGNSFLVAYEKLLLKYGTDYKNVRHENIDEKKLNEFFEGGYTNKTFPNKQVFDLAGVTGRLLSSSYTPQYDSPLYEPMLAELNEIFEKNQVNGKIEFLYDTNIYINSKQLS
ncbi:MAG TPA: class I SAM-dependent methyltransferase [Ignavibacteria bacterium]|nr:SAM-dependent methyltransferase [Bacteroidota bacterium]HRE12233.1 class I SAM-dependent methyltransferase [Ignavibacteria bacterium]HRF65013.1 class I SAM-dependent methyltransferase [Ignavibacteria bacterium]